MWRSAHPERDRRDDAERRGEVDAGVSELLERERGSLERVTAAKASEHSTGQEEAGAGPEGGQEDADSRAWGCRHTEQHGEEARRSGDNHGDEKPAEGIRTRERHHEPDDAARDAQRDPEPEGGQQGCPKSS
jgi:hypothetical protein